MKACALLAAGCALLAACRSSGSEQDELPFELRLQFEGEKSLDEERLSEIVRRELARLTLTEPDKAAVDDAAFALELLYRSRGHVDVWIDYDFEPATASAPALARFRITEGPAVRVRELVLEGRSAIDPETARAYLGTGAVGDVYDALRLEAGLENLRGLYQERGHLRIAIEEPVVDEPVVEPDRASATVAIRVVLHEGPVFRVRAVEMQGGVPDLAQREARLAERFTHDADEGRTVLYSPRILPEIQHTLVEEYRRRGHPDVTVQVQPELDETSGDVRIIVQIAPGERVTVAHFRIQGNVRTKDAAILGVMGIERGTLHDSEREREAFRELYATGLFESVSLALEGTGPERTLVVDVVEARSVEIRLEPGWGSYEGPRVLVGIEEKNFQGRGQVLSLEGTASLRAQALRLGWVDRDFLGTSLTAETSAFVEYREEPAFEFTRRGLGFFLRRELGEDWSTSLGYEYRPTNVTDDNASSAPDDTNVAALSVGLALDDRDNLLLPTRGRQGRAGLEWADKGLGSDTEFLRARLEYTHLFRLSERGVLAVSARTGVIAPLGITNSAEIPLPERFFNGGESTVRSFREDELFPEDPLDPARPQDGGEATTTLNLELRRMLTGNLAGAVFFDWGNVTAQVRDYFDFDGFRPGVGAGLRYLLPIGPVRLDLAHNGTADPDEDDWVLHFSVGFPF